MHKFWIFPLILGIVGAVCPVLCTVHAVILLNSMVTLPLGFNSNAQVPSVFTGCFLHGFGAGALLGLGAAWREHKRDRARSQPGDWNQNGVAMAAKMASNAGWLMGYALLFNISTGLTLWGIAQTAWFPAELNYYYFPGYYDAVAVVYLVAIVWAARRTAHTDDILTPRVALAKLEASTEMTPRKRKPSRRDAEV